MTESADDKPTGLSDEQRTQAKGLFKEALQEWVDEKRAEEDTQVKRTEKPKASAWTSLFGG